MGFFGAKFWDDKSRYYDQTNNPTEEMLRKQGIELAKELQGTGLTLNDTQRRFVLRWLESCGGATSASCMEMVGIDLSIKTAIGTLIDADEAIVDWLNNPKNYSLLRKEVSWLEPATVPNNRNAPYYPVMAREMFGAKALHSTSLKRQDWIDLLRAGCTIQACINPPGHYIALKVYDTEKDIFGYNDSWSSRKSEWNGNGFGQWLTKSEEDTIVSEFVVYYPK